MIVNNFLHDLATGVWFGLFLVMWRLNTLVGRPAYSGLSPVARDLFRHLFTWGTGALAAVLVSGAIRTFTYGRTPIAAADRATKLRLLIAKHILFVLLFGAGVYFEYRLAYAFRPVLG